MTNIDGPVEFVITEFDCNFNPRDPKIVVNRLLLLLLRRSLSKEKLAMKIASVKKLLYEVGRYFEEVINSNMFLCFSLPLNFEGK